MPLLLATFVLWAYICSSFVYKTWYLATALALTTLAEFAARPAQAARNAGVPPAEQAASPPPSPTANGLPPALIIPATIVDAIEHLRSNPADPAATRLAPYAVTLLAILVPFLVLRETQAPRSCPYRLAMAITFALLVLGRNRASLATALVLLAISIVTFARIREALIQVAIIAITIGALLSGLVHQVQQSPAPFVLLAVGAARGAEEHPIA